MDSKELDIETIKPALKTDEEVSEGQLDKFELEKNDEIINEEFGYESHRSPFPEGEFSLCLCYEYVGKLTVSFS
jgi:hypothetical protein